MLAKDHPALGAFRKKKTKPRPDWQFIADELYVELRKRMEHNPGEDGGCPCSAHMALDLYDRAKFRALELS